MISNLPPGDRLALKGKIFELQKKLHVIDCLNNKQEEQYSFKPSIIPYNLPERNTDFLECVNKAELIRKQRKELLKQSVEMEQNEGCTFSPAINHKSHHRSHHRSHHKSSHRSAPTQNRGDEEESEKSQPAHERLTKMAKQYRAAHEHRCKQAKRFDFDGKRMFQPAINRSGSQIQSQRDDAQTVTSSQKTENVVGSSGSGNSSVRRSGQNMDNNRQHTKSARGIDVGNTKRSTAAATALPTATSVAATTAPSSVAASVEVVSADEFLYQDARDREERLKMKRAEARMQAEMESSVPKMNSSSHLLVRRKAVRDARNLFSIFCGDDPDKGSIELEDLLRLEAVPKVYSHREAAGATATVLSSSQNSYNNSNNSSNRDIQAVASSRSTALKSGSNAGPQTERSQQQQRLLAVAVVAGDSEVVAAEVAKRDKVVRSEQQQNKTRPFAERAELLQVWSALDILQDEVVPLEAFLSLVVPLLVHDSAAAAHEEIFGAGAEAAPLSMGDLRFLKQFLRRCVTALPYWLAQAAERKERSQLFAPHIYAHSHKLAARKDRKDKVAILSLLNKKAGLARSDNANTHTASTDQQQEPLPPPPPTAPVSNLVSNQDADDQAQSAADNSITDNTGSAARLTTRPDLMFARSLLSVQKKKHLVRQRHEAVMQDCIFQPQLRRSKSEATKSEATKSEATKSGSAARNPNPPEQNSASAVASANVAQSNNAATDDDANCVAPHQVGSEEQMTINELRVCNGEAGAVNEEADDGGDTAAANVTDTADGDGADIQTEQKKEPVFDRLYKLDQQQRIKVEQQHISAKEARLVAEMQECTFHPVIGTRTNPHAAAAVAGAVGGGSRQLEPASSSFASIASSSASTSSSSSGNSYADSNLHPADAATAAVLLASIEGPQADEIQQQPGEILPPLPPVTDGADADTGTDKITPDSHGASQRSTGENKDESFAINANTLKLSEPGSFDQDGISELEDGDLPPSSPLPADSSNEDLLGNHPNKKIEGFDKSVARMRAAHAKKLEQQKQQSDATLHRQNEERYLRSRELAMEGVRPFAFSLDERREQQQRSKLVRSNPNLIVDVKLNANKTAKIQIWHGDDPVVVADSFGLIYSLDRNARQLLVTVIRQSMMDNGVVVGSSGGSTSGMFAADNNNNNNSIMPPHENSQREHSRSKQRSSFTSDAADHNDVDGTGRVVGDRRRHSYSSNYSEFNDDRTLEGAALSTADETALGRSDSDSDAQSYGSEHSA